jgi:hypothetical protein
MFSISLIGPDGAGETTIARMLEKKASLPFMYISLAINISASSYALLKSRFFWHPATGEMAGSITREQGINYSG